MNDFSDENRKYIKMLGGAEKMKHDFRNNKKAVIRIARLLKQIILDENEIDYKNSVKVKDMKNYTKKGNSKITRDRQKRGGK